MHYNAYIWKEEGGGSDACSIRGFCFGVLCFWYRLCKHTSETSRTLFSGFRRFDSGRGVLALIKTLSSRLVSGKDEGVF